MERFAPLRFRLQVELGDALATLLRKAGGGSSVIHTGGSAGASSQSLHGVTLVQTMGALLEDLQAKWTLALATDDEEILEMLPSAPASAAAYNAFAVAYALRH
mmetsp:Transcript_58724/g.116623  ORF Transcript_58724/g.116623 Transcript_58724/m.116623 type:complete len:103 (-) Transcript_58724:823-1131(-)